MGGRNRKLGGEIMGSMLPYMSMNGSDDLDTETDAKKKKSGKKGPTDEKQNRSLGIKNLFGNTLLKNPTMGINENDVKTLLDLGGA